MMTRHMKQLANKALSSRMVLCSDIINCSIMQCRQLETGMVYNLLIVQNRQ